MSIADTDDGTVVWHCHAGCDGRDIGREIYRRELLLGHVASARTAAGRRPPRSIVAADRSKLDRLLSKLLPIEGSPVAAYLGTRDLALPPDGHSLRYLPATPPKFLWPCMVGIVTDFADASRVLSLHFTRLRPDGLGKAPLPKHEQRSYLAGFPKKGGVIRLCADAEVENGLGVAEGIETALSVMTSFGRSNWFQPVWAALDAGNMARLPVVAGIETLTIYADCGPVGDQAAQQLAQRWIEEGRDVYICTAPVDDWNLAMAS